ncbi:MAG: hypothetical protein LBG73_10175, partial [Spirochaetaceae bacterium]|nr:hypothetical protein [Spirochaetaceae bacterium]
SIEYVKAHLERMKVLREYANRNGDKRVYLAGAAGAVIQENVKDYALSQGLYVIEMSGETVTVVPPKYVAKWTYTA